MRWLLVVVTLAGCEGSMDATPRDGARNDGGAPDDGSTGPDAIAGGDATPGPDGGGPGTDGGGPLPISARCPEGITSDPDVGQALPSIDLDVAMPAATGRTITVAAGGDLQAAIDMAAPGDVIELEADATFSGPFTLPEKSGDGYVVIRTATPDAMLPPEGTRIDPSFAPLLPDLVSSGGPVFRTATRAHHYRLVGLEIAPAAGSFIYALVELGASDATSAAEQAHHIVIDRSYFRAEPDEGTRRAIALNAGATAIIDSWFAGFFQLGSDSQAIGGWNGPGPYRILNNHLEAASENIIFGGADPAIPDLVPSDIEIWRNHFTKPIEWLGMSRVVKNLFELKNARRVLLAGNVLEHCWSDGQVGFAIVLTPRNQDGGGPWSTIEDVTIVQNVIRRVGAGINVLGEDDLHPSGQQQRVVIRDNLIEVDTGAFPGAGRALQLITPGRPTAGVAFVHNTVRVIGNSFLTMGDSGPVAVPLYLRDNVAEHSSYGIFGGGVGEGTTALDQYAPGHDVRGNVLIGYTESSYPAGNFFPADDAAVGFGAGFRLAPGSPYAGMATDGTDPGADMDALDDAIAGVAP